MNLEDLREKGLWLLKPCTRKLVGFLSHANPKLRSEGARSLGKIADKEAVQPLIDALLKEKQDEQLPLALAEIGDSAALPPLITAFKEAGCEVKPNIALAMGAFKNPMTLGTLIQGLSDLDPNVRFCCITALGNLRDSAAVSNLLGCLSESNEWIFLNVVDSLAKIGAHIATNPLVAFYLKERNERKRAAIITALGQIGDLTAVPTLTKALRDIDDRVKANAVESLANLNLPPEKTINLIQPFLKHLNNRVRGNAMVAIGKIGTVDLKPIMHSMINDSDKWLRATLGYVLSVIECEGALDMIIELLKDDDADVRKNAAAALANRASEAQTELLIRMLSDTAPLVKLQAVITLGKLRIAAAVPWLIKLLKSDRNFKIRSAVVTGLGRIGDKSGIATLQNALRDRDSRVRANAVESLEEALSIAAIPIIRPMLKDSDNRTRSNAAKALFRLGDFDIFKEMCEMLDSREMPTRISAAYALGQMGLALRELDTSPLLSPLKEALYKTETPKRREVHVEREVHAEPDVTKEKALSRLEEKKEPEKPLSDKEAQKQMLLDLIRDGKHKEALTIAEECLALSPNDIKILFTLGNLYVQLNDLVKAEECLAKAVKLDPLHVLALSNLGVVYFKLGKLNDSIEVFKKALHIKPDMPLVRFNLAGLLLKNSRWQEAIRQFEEGLRYQSPTARILSNLAFAYQKIGEAEKAAETYKRVLKLNNKDAGVYYNLALILIKQGQTRQASELLTRAFELVESDDTGMRNLRDLFDRLNPSH